MGRWPFASDAGHVGANDPDYTKQHDLRSFLSGGNRRRKTALRVSPRFCSAAACCPTLSLDMKRLLVPAIVVAAVWWLFFRPTGRLVTITSISLMPFPITVTFCLPTKDACVPQVVTIEPGQSIQFDWKFSPGRDALDVALSADGPIAQAIYGGPMPFAGDRKRQVGEEMLSFQMLALEPELETSLVFAAPDPDDPSLLLMPLADSIEESQEQARALAATLPRRLTFIEAMADRPMPIVSGAVFSDANTSFGPGVDVDSAIPVTPLGSPVNLQSNDVLLKINGEPIFGITDIYRILLAHVNTRSAGVPYTFRVRRDGRVLDSTSSAFFSDAFFVPTADGSREAFARAIARSLTLGTGLDRAMLCAAGYDSAFSALGQSCLVAQRNQQLLLAQQHATADLLGSLVAVPVPILRVPFARLLPARGGGRVAARLLAEMAEASLIAANDAPSGVDRAGRAIAAAPWGAATGVLVTARPSTLNRALHTRR
jgi:hypothetical protein